MILEQNILLVVVKWKTIILGCFLPSFSSFDRVVPEEIYFIFKTVNKKRFFLLANYKQDIL